jgi:hypothetical protein
MEVLAHWGLLTPQKDMGSIKYKKFLQIFNKLLSIQQNSGQYEGYTLPTSVN